MTAASKPIPMGHKVKGRPVVKLDQDVPSTEYVLNFHGLVRCRYVYFVFFMFFAAQATLMKTIPAIMEFEKSGYNAQRVGVTIVFLYAVDFISKCLFNTVQKDKVGKLLRLSGLS